MDKTQTNLDEIVHSWSLQRYARRSPVISSDAEKSPLITDDNGQWAVQSSTESGSNLSLMLTRHQQLIVLKDTNMIMESIFLMNARKCCKAIVKGDSILFLYKASGLQSGTRQFRVKFNFTSKTNDDSVQRCKNFVDVMNHMIHFMDGESEGPVRTSSVEMPQAVQAILFPSTSSQLKAQPTFNVDDGLENSIASCLADPSFPAFVDSVEEHLLKLTAKVNPMETTISQAP